MARLDLYLLEKELGKSADALLDADGTHLGPALEKRVHAAVAPVIETGLFERFEEGVDPRGDPWEPLSEKAGTTRTPAPWRLNPAQRHDSHPLLDLFDLLYSLRAGHQHHVRETEDHVLRVGTTVPYAGFHQDGTRRVPARPFLGIADADLEAVADIAALEVVAELWP